MTIHTPIAVGPTDAAGKPEAPAKRLPEISVKDCRTAADWERWARERREYENPYGYDRERF